MMGFRAGGGERDRAAASELRVLGTRAIVAAMRVPGSWSLLLAASLTSSLAVAQPAATGAATAPPPEPAPPSPPEPTPAPPPPADDTASATSGPSAAPSDTVGAAPGTGVTSAKPAHAEVRAGATSPVGVSPAAANAQPSSDFTRNFQALPLTLEARLGFNARLGSSFDDATDEERWGASYAFATYFAWRPEFALGLELDHSGLGSVRALSGQNSIDNQYTATGTWLGARVFPIRLERLDFFVNLRVGMVFQHVDAFGTRSSGGSITEPAQSYSCAEWDGPGIGLGGGLGAAYRLGRHISFVSRVDLNGARLSSETLGTCADGIGSVASLSGSVGLAFEFETAPK